MADYSEASGPIIYPLEMIYSFGAWLRRTNGEEWKFTPWRFIAPEAIARMQSGQCFLLITHLKRAERDAAYFDLFADLHRKIAMLGIPEEQVIFLGCTEEITDLYEETLSRVGITKRFRAVLRMPYFEYVWHAYYRRYLAEDRIWTADHAKANWGLPKPKRMLCYNREMRAHRVINALYLQKRGYFDTESISFAEESDNFSFKQFNSFGEGIDNIFSDPGILELLGGISNLRKAIPRSVDFPDVRKLRISYCTKEPFRDSYFSLITERVFHTRAGHRLLTSKPFKCAANMHPFLLLGAAGVLRDFRSYGYRTFSPWIDEAYDEESDPNRRMLMVWAELDRIMAFSPQELHEWYQGMESILLHNWEHQQERAFSPVVRREAEKLFAVIGGSDVS